MKIIQAMPGMSAAMTESEIDSFLTSKLNIQIGSIDDQGDPNIQPVWFYYDSPSKKIFVETGKDTKKTANIRKRPTIYFSIDDENSPYKGVKGKADVQISEDPKKNRPIAEKIMVKYLGSLEHPIAKTLLGYVDSGVSVIMEISPRFYSTWDMSKM